MLGPADLLAQVQPGGFASVVDKIGKVPLSVVVVFSACFTILRLAVWPTLKGTHPDDRANGLYSLCRIANEVSDAVVYAGIFIFMLVRPFCFQTFFIPSGSMIDTLRPNDYIVANKWVYRVTEPRRGDIIVFRPPKGALMPGQLDSDTNFIKRLIGVPGDIVEWKDKQLYLNGRPVKEPYVDYTHDDDPDGPVLPRDQWGQVQQADYKLVNDHGVYVPVRYDGETVNTWNLTGGFLEQDPLTLTYDYVPTSAAEAERWLKSPPAPVPKGYYLFMGDNRNGSFDGRAWGLVKRQDIIGKSEFIWFPPSRVRKTQ